MLTTARRHFDEDIKRAEDLHALGTSTVAANATVAGDIFRAAVVAAVGAMDAYLCDAYVDCLAGALLACRTQKEIQLPSAYAKETLPVGPIVAAKYTKRQNWALRMAARHRMEKDNLLQIGRVKDMINPVLPAGQKLWNDIIDKYIALNRRSLTKINQNELGSVPAKDKAKARNQAAAALLRRIGEIVQRRHDIAHNCDRPRTAIQALGEAKTKKMVRDVKSFVTILDDHLEAHRVF